MKTLLIFITTIFLFSFSVFAEDNTTDIFKTHYYNYLNISDYVKDDVERREVEFQLSVEVDVTPNFIGDYFKIFGAYTVESKWRLFDSATSRDFRESNQNPQFFIRVGDNKHKIDVGYWHESNGGSYDDTEDCPVNMSCPETRSWDRAYIEYQKKLGNFTGNIKGWDVFMTEHKDIIDLMGYGEITLQYNIDKILLWKEVRVETNFSKGHLKNTLSWKALIFDNVHISVGTYSGYGHSLIDYDKHIQSATVGLILARD